MIAIASHIPAPSVSYVKLGTWLNRGGSKKLKNYFTTMAGSQPIMKKKKPPQKRGRFQVAKKKDRTVDGILFASKKEAMRYTELKKQEEAGEIKDLALQPRYAIRVKGKHICYYTADFRYVRGRKRIVEDVKGYKTAVYRLKKKLMLAVHGIDIQES